MGADAVRFFVGHATVFRPGFRLSSQNASAVARICRRLDGLPLALQLAAAAVTVLSAEELAGRLDAGAALSPSASATTSGRQRTLRATFDWSYTLLSASEKRLFDRLSVFSDGWTLDAAQQVCEGSVLDSLSQLVAKSLVVAEDEAGSLRFRLLQPLREYGLDHFRRSAEEPALRERHLAYFVALAQQADPQFWRAQHATWFRRFDRELGNVRTALEWSLDGDEARAESGLRLASSLWRYWDLRGHLAEAQEWVAKLLPRVSRPTGARASGLAAAGYFAVIQGESASGVSFAEEGLAVARQVGETSVLLDALMLCGLVRVFTGDLQRATELWGQTLALGTHATSPVHMGASYYWQGELARIRGNPAQAKDLFEQSRIVACALGNTWSEAYSLEALGLVALGLNDYERARSFMLQSLDLRCGLEDARGVPWSLEVLSWVAAAQGQAERAARLLGAAEGLNEAVGSSLSAAWHTQHNSATAAAETQLGQTAFTRAWARGRATDLLAAVAYAREPGLKAVGDRFLAPLSAREHQVAVLVAQGLSNRRIAEQLVISESTAHRHVANILAKLGFDTRAQIAAWAATAPGGRAS